MASLPPVFIEFLGRSDGVKRAMADIKRESRKTAEEGETSFGKFGRLGTAAVAGIGLAAAGAAVGAVKMAADFETQMTRVRTGAGETAANMKTVSDGVLAMAGQVGMSTSQLTTGLYTVESAGYHGADALNVLRNSAMGAKVGAADLGTVTDAVTTALNAYKLGAGQATEVTNALIGTEAEGKTNMEALAGSLSNVLPTAAAAHVGLQEVLGAMATMTAQGTPAAVAATYLRQTIGALSNPSGKAAQEMQSLGLSAVKVGQNLGSHGLASTLNMLTDAIQRKMGPAGTVLIDHLAKAAKQSNTFQKALANLPPAQQTYIGALATMVGGTKSMQAALELTGPHMKDFEANTKGIGQHVAEGGKKIEGWADVQKTLNQKLSEAKAGLQAMTIQIGQALLPVATRIMGVISETVTWLTKHKAAAEAVAIVIGGALVFALAAMAAQLYAVAAAAAVNPLTWIVLAVVAVIAAIVMLAMHWREVWAGIKAVAEAVGRAVAAAWHWVAAQTVSVWHSITGAVTSAWHAVASFFSSAWHAVADPIVAAWHWVEHTTSAVWGAISAFFKRWWPLLLVIFMPFVALVMAIWNHFHTQITKVAHTVWGAITGFFKATWDVIKAVAGVVWKGIQIAIVQPIEAVWHALQEVWGVISGWLSSAWHGIERVAGVVWGAIKAAIINPIMGAWHTITSIVGRIASALGNGIRGAWNTVSGWIGKFWSIGSNIVWGIIHGVENAAGSLFSSLKNLASNALDAAKSFLGINSPSKLFADHVGMAIPEGVAKGVNDHAHLAHAAVRQMAGTLSAQTVSLGTVGGSYAGATAGGYGAGQPQVAEVTTVVQLDGRVLFEVMQKKALQYERRNLTNGLTLNRA